MSGSLSLSLPLLGPLVRPSPQSGAQWTRSPLIIGDSPIAFFRFFLTKPIMSHNRDSHLKSAYKAFIVQSLRQTVHAHPPPVTLEARESDASDTRDTSASS